MRWMTLCCLFLFANAAWSDTSFTEVATGVFLSEGEIADVFSSDDGNVANTVFIIGEDAVAVIDTGASLGQGKAILKAIRKKTQLPIRYVINTHVHLDHIFGNQAFVSEAPEFIAHENFARQLASRGSYYKERLEEVGLGADDIISPTRTISGTTVIDLGNRLLRLSAMSPAHTNNDLLVYDMTTATMITGDLVFVDHCPSLDGDLNGWITVIASLQATDFNLMIPGHGPPQTNRHALDKMEYYLTNLRYNVRQAIYNQIDIQTASDTLMQDESINWQLFDEFHKRNVINAYTQLEWE